MTAKPGSVFEHINPSGQKVYKVEIIVGYNPDGSKKTTRRTAHTKREAERLRWKLAAQVEDGTLGSSGLEHLEDFALWWIREVHSRKVRKATAADYESRFRAHIQPTFGRRKLSAITSKDITAWLRQLEKHPYADTTINGALQVLRAILKAAVKERKIVYNPAEGIPLRSNPTRPNVKSPWSRDEALEALSAAKGEFIELPLLLGIHLGLREEEIVGLKWTDLSFTEGTLSINRGLREVGLYDENGKRHYQMVEQLPKTISSERLVTMTYDLQSALIGQRERLQTAGIFDEKGWVFANKSEWPIRPNRMAKLYRDFLKTHHFRQIRFHDLRHTAAHLSFEAGVPIEAISQDLGHRDINTTKLIYGRKVAALSSRRSEALQEYLSSAEREISEIQGVGR